MTHEELMKELYEVCAFLIKKSDLLESQYSFDKEQIKWKLNLEDEDDRAIFNFLLSTCNNTRLFKLYDSETGYLAKANEFKYRDGDGVRERMRAEETE